MRPSIVLGVLLLVAVRCDAQLFTTENSEEIHRKLDLILNRVQTNTDRIDVIAESTAGSIQILQDKIADLENQIKTNARSIEICESKIVDNRTSVDSVHDMQQKQQKDLNYVENNQSSGWKTVSSTPVYASASPVYASASPVYASASPVYAPSPVVSPAYSTMSYPTMSSTTQYARRGPFGGRVFNGPIFGRSVPVSRTTATMGGFSSGVSCSGSS